MPRVGNERGLRTGFVVAVLFANLLVWGQAGFNVEAQNKHRVTVDDFDTLKEAELLSLSPDGKMLAYSTWESDLWLVATRPGSLPHQLAKGTFPLWSPDGKHLAYYSDVSGTFQLWVLDNDSGHAEQVTHVQGGIDPDHGSGMSGWRSDPLRYSWSPDGSKLVFPSQVTLAQAIPKVQNQRAAAPLPNDTQAPLVLTTTTPANWTLRGIFSREFSKGFTADWEKNTDSNSGDAYSLPARTVSQLFVIDVGTKTLKQLTNDDGMYFNPDWSPDGQRIVCASSEGRALHGEFWQLPATNIYLIDVITGAKQALTKGAGERRVPHWSPDGKWIAYSFVERFGMQFVYVIPRGGGTPIKLTSALDRSVELFHWSPDSNSIIVVTQDGVSYPISRVAFPTGTFTRLSESAAAYRWATAISATGSFVWEESSKDSTGVIHILPVGAVSSYVLLNMNPQIKEWELGEQEVFRWKNRRGDEMEGILIKPVEYEEGHRYPLIVDGYPGIASGLAAGPMIGNQAWAARGYVVFFPDARAPHTWMNRFRNPALDHAAKGPKGWDVTVDDVLSGVDELVGRGIVDPERMGLYGFSNGGGVVNYLVTRTDRFKCAVSVAGSLSDWIRPVLMHSDQTVLTTWAGDITPWDDPGGYIELSAVYHIRSVKTPMLLAVGDEDGDFLIDTIEMYNGLRWFGRDVTLLRYPGQEHGFTGVAFTDFWKRETSFFDKYLTPGKSTK